MARRRMGVADVKEILVAWDVGENISAIAHRLGYSRPTVRKYTQAATQAGLERGGVRRGEEEWERVARAAIQRMARRGNSRWWRSGSASRRRCSRCRRSRGSRSPGRRPRCSPIATCGSAIPCIRRRIATSASASMSGWARGQWRSTPARSWLRRTRGRSAGA